LTRGNPTGDGLQRKEGRRSGYQELLRKKGCQMTKLQIEKGQLVRVECLGRVPAAVSTERVLDGKRHIEVESYLRGPLQHSRAAAAL